MFSSQLFRNPPLLYLSVLRRLPVGFRSAFFLCPRWVVPIMRPNNSFTHLRAFSIHMLSTVFLLFFFPFFTGSVFQWDGLSLVTLLCRLPPLVESLWNNDRFIFPTAGWAVPLRVNLAPLLATSGCRSITHFESGASPQIQLGLPKPEEFFFFPSFIFYAIEVLRNTPLWMTFSLSPLSRIGAPSRWEPVLRDPCRPHCGPPLAVF